MVRVDLSKKRINSTQLCLQQGNVACPACALCTGVAMVPLCLVTTRSCTGNIVLASSLDCQPPVFIPCLPCLRGKPH